jgi:hypothetical protein
MGPSNAGSVTALVLLLAPVLGSAALAAAMQEPPPPGERTPPTAQQILQQQKSAFVDRLEAVARCSATRLGEGIGRFSWHVVEPIGSKYRVDISMFRSGLDDGRFETIGVVPPEQTFIEWRAPRAGVNYKWRVLALTPKGWLPSQTARFIGPVCPVDYTEEPPRGPD